MPSILWLTKASTQSAMVQYCEALLEKVPVSIDACDEVQDTGSTRILIRSSSTQKRQQEERLQLKPPTMVPVLEDNGERPEP